MNDRPVSTGSFIRFGDNAPIAVAAIRFERPTVSAAAESPVLAPPASLEAEIPVSPETAQQVCRVLGLTGVADRIEITTHPDLAELAARLTSYYGALWDEESTE